MVLEKFYNITFGPAKEWHSTSFSSYFMNGPNKLQCLSKVNLSSLV